MHYGYTTADTTAEDAIRLDVETLKARGLNPLEVAATLEVPWSKVKLYW